MGVRRVRSAVLCGMVLCVGLTRPAMADNRADTLAERDRLVAEALRLRESDDLPGAIATLEKAMASARPALDPAGDPEVDRWARLIRWHAEAGKLDAARRVARDLIAARERALGKDDWQAAFARRLLSDLDRVAAWDEPTRARFRRSGQLMVRIARAPEQAPPPELLAAAEELESLRRLLWGDEHFEVALSLWKRGRLIAATGEHDRARRLFEQAAERMRRALGDRHSYLGTTLVDLGVARFENKHPESAEAALSEAAKVFAATVGKGGTEYLDAVALLVELAGARGDANVLEARLREVLGLHEAMFGPGGIGVGIASLRLGSLLLARDRPAEALPVLERALAVLKPHADRAGEQASALDALAQTHRALGHARDAEALAREALGLHIKAHGASSPEVALAATSLAALLQQRGDVAGALHLLEETLRPFAGDSRRTPNAQLMIGMLAGLHDAASQPVKSVPLWREILNAREAAAGPDAPESAEAAGQLGRALKMSGDGDGAEPFLVRAAASHEKTGRSRSAQAYLVQDGLREIYAARRDTLRAREAAARAQAAAEAVLGEMAPLHLASLSYLADALLADGCLDEAIAILERETSLRRKNSKDPGLVLALDKLARAWFRKQQPARAEAPRREILTVVEASSGLDSPAAAEAALELGVVLSMIKKVDAAEPLLVRAQKGLGDKPTIGLYQCLRTLAHVARTRGDLVSARDRYRQAYPVGEQLFGKRSPFPLDDLANLGLVLTDLKDYAGAEPVLVRELEGKEVAYAKEPAEIAHALDHLSTLYGLTDRRQKEKEASSRALAIRKAALGEKSIYTAQSYWRVGGACVALKRYAEAVPLFTRSIEIHETLGQTRDVGYMSALESLATAHAALGDQRAALNLHERAAAAMKTARGETDPEYARMRLSVAMSYQALGEHRRAEMEFGKVADLERLRGDEAPGYAQALQHVALSLAAQGRIVEAKVPAARAVSILEKLPASHAAKLVEALERYGDTCARLGELDQAESALRRAVSVAREKLGKGHRDTALASIRLAQLHWDQGNASAREDVVQAIDALRKLLGEDDPIYISNLMSLAVRDRGAGDYRSAEAEMRRIIDLQRRYRGETHPDTLQSRLLLASVCVNLRRFDESRRLIAEVRAAHERSGDGALFTAEIDEATAFLVGQGPDKGQSLDYLRKAIETRRAVQGEGHPAVVGGLKTLAISYNTRLEHERAESYAREALVVAERSAGPQSEGYAGALSLLGDIFAMKGDHAKARDFYGRAADIRRMIGGKESLRYAESLLELGELDVTHGDLARALTTSREALEVFTRRLGRTHPKTANGLDAVAAVLRAQGDAVGARALLAESAANRLRALGELHPDYIRALDRLARVQQLAGESAEAAQTCRRALELRRKMFDDGHPDIAAAKLALALPLESLGDAKQARALAEEARRSLAADPGPRSPPYAAALTRLASSLMQAGDLNAAERLFREAREIQRATPDDQGAGLLETLQQLAALYAMTGDLAGTEAVLAEAEHIAASRLGADNLMTSLTRVLLALVYLERHDARLGPLLAELDRASAVRRADTPMLPALMTTVRAQEAKSRGDFAGAARLFAEALGLIARLFPSGGSASLACLEGMASSQRLAGSLGEAEDSARRLLERTEATVGTEHLAYARALGELAALEVTRGRAEKAEPHYRRALEINRRILDRTFGDLSERRQIEMTRSLRGFLDAYLALSTAVPDERSYEYVLAWKGAVSARQRRSPAGRDASQPAFEALQGEAGNLTRRLAALVLAVPNEGGSSGRARAIAETSARLDGVEAQIARLRAPGDAPAKPVTPRSLADALPDGNALVDLLEYNHGQPPPSGRGSWATERRLVAFVSRKGRPVIRVELGAAEPAEALLVRWQPESNRAPEGESRPAAAKLRAQIWDPLEPALQGATVVLISPDGFTARVPFAAFPGRASGKYLLEERSMCTVAAPRLLPELLRTSSSAPSPAGRSEGMVVVGDVDFGPAEPIAIAVGVGPAAPFPALRSTASEIQAVTGAWAARGASGQSTVLRGAAATEAALRKAASHAQYLHLATHGFFIPDPPRRDSATTASGTSIPLLPGSWFGVANETLALGTTLPAGLRSGLALAGANRSVAGRPAGDGHDDDGLLTALEVAQSDLAGVEFVVLSACDTGLGRVAGGEGVLGLQRAFEVAGARTVIASLWKVNDAATQALMVEFYRNLWDRRLPRIEALRQAQIAMLKGTLAPADALTRGVAGFAPAPSAPPSTRTTTPGRLHPAFWAGFIMSGDWR